MKINLLHGWRAPLPQTKPVDNTLLTLLALALFALYASTAAPVVGFEDSAGFAASCLNADIAHAPGYPLYALLCHPFSYLPVKPAFAAALFSALCAAAAVWCLGKVVYMLTADAVCALGVAALYGVSRTYWSQATIPEVYALNVLLFMAAWWALLHWRAAPSTLGLALVAGLSGLALANHWPLFVLGALAFVPLLWGQRGWLWRRLRQPKSVLLWGGVFVLGLLPYAYLVWRSHHPEAFVRLPFAPDSVAALWQIVSRDVLAPQIDNPAGSGVADKVGFALFLTKRVLLEEVSWLGGVLVVAGLVLQWRQVGAAAGLALCVLFATATVGLVLLLNFIYDGVGRQIFTPYPLLPYAVACIWAGLALRRLLPQWRGVALALLCVLTLGINFRDNDRSGDRLAADIADMYLHTLPAGAFFPLPPLHQLLAYQQYVTGARPEVRLLPAPNPYVGQTVTPGEKLYPPNALTFAGEMEAVNAYAAAHPLCYNTYVPFAVTRPSREYLIFSCLQAPGAAALPRAAVDERISIFLRYVMQHYQQSDNWHARTLMARMLGDAMRTLMQLRAANVLPPQWRELLEDLSATPPGQLALMEYLVGQPGFVLSAARVEVFRNAAEVNLPYLNLRQQARLLSALADSYAAVTPRTEEALAQALALHQQAAALLPAADVPAVQAAWRFYQREGLAEEAAEMEATYGEALHTADMRKLQE